MYALVPREIQPPTFQRETQGVCQSKGYKLQSLGQSADVLATREISAVSDVEVLGDNCGAVNRLHLAVRRFNVPDLGQQCEA